MNAVIALAAVAVLACGAAVAADTPATTDKSAPAAADKPTDKKKGPEKGSDNPITPRASSAAMPSYRSSGDASPGTTGTPAKSTGLESSSARDRPATAATPMTGTRALPKKDADGKSDNKGSGAGEPRAAVDSTTAAPKKVDGGLEPTSARDRPATQPTPVTGTRGLSRPPGDSKAPAEPPAPPAKQ